MLTRTLSLKFTAILFVHVDIESKGRGGTFVGAWTSPENAAATPMGGEMCMADITHMQESSKEFLLFLVVNFHFPLHINQHAVVGAHNKIASAQP